MQAGDLDKAVESYTDALLIGNPTALLYTRRADILLKQKRYAAAIRDCDEALKLNPDNARAYRIRGTAHRQGIAQHIDTGFLFAAYKRWFSCDTATMFFPFFRYLGHWKQAHSDIEMGQKVGGSQFRRCLPTQ